MKLIGTLWETVNEIPLLPGLIGGAVAHLALFKPRTRIDAICGVIFGGVCAYAGTPWALEFAGLSIDKQIPVCIVIVIFAQQGGEQISQWIRAAKFPVFGGKADGPKN